MRRWLGGEFGFDLRAISTGILACMRSPRCTRTSFGYIYHNMSMEVKKSSCSGGRPRTCFGYLMKNRVVGKVFVQRRGRRRGGRTSSRRSFVGEPDGALEPDKCKSYNDNVQ